MSKGNKLGDFAKSLANGNHGNTPLQEIKKGVVKPIEKTFLLSLKEEKLTVLKQMALDKKTSVRSLINKCIDEMYFK
ncbi:hypothetical protein [Kaistella sp.]|uniref:hypothetical protein n=1 Tax=Kaistella sp. TaxID=2782235 RepID=UPI0035A06424